MELEQQRKIQTRRPQPPEHQEHGQVVERSHMDTKLKPSTKEEQVEAEQCQTVHAVKSLMPVVVPYKTAIHTQMSKSS